MASINDVLPSEWDRIVNKLATTCSNRNQTDIKFDEKDPQFTKEEWRAVEAHAVVDKSAVRKGTPVFSGVLKYFPDALRAIAVCSKVGNDQHNPDKALFWDRSKSGDELDALTRHLMEAGTVDSDGIRHSAKVAWRALANLQKELEEAGETW